MISQQTYKLPGSASSEVAAALTEWDLEQKSAKLWRGDPSLWTGDAENKWIGWLTIVPGQLAHPERLRVVARDAQTAGFDHVLLLGMGGSSLCPEVMRMTFGKIAGYPELHVLDSTDPAQIQSIEKRIDLAKTLFIVSSKSGGTLEPNIFKQYFFARVQALLGVEKEGDAGIRFIAITDPGSKMEEVAHRDHFRHILFGDPGIGGRYSALSDFGMAPAAVMGVDVSQLLNRTMEMVKACGAAVPAAENPGVVLGTILGVLSRHRDKVTIVASPGISDLGAWLEQLIAESTGKQGHGLIPVDREALGSPDRYSDDRVFAYLRLETAPDAAQDAAIAALENAGQPVVRIAVEDIYAIGAEFFRWEIATAVAGSIIGINPFDQPDVEASKIATRKITEQYEKDGHLPPEAPFFSADGVHLFSDAANVAALRKAVGPNESLSGYLRAHVDRLAAGDYFAVLGYIEMNAAHQAALQAIRHTVRDARKVATCLGFGPRFLHSTGQAYKGGPNTGVFLQITCNDPSDLPVPGQKYTFGVVKAAQARGDFEVLSERKRRALRVHLDDVTTGLAALKNAL